MKKLLLLSILSISALTIFSACDVTKQSPPVKSTPPQSLEIESEESLLKNDEKSSINKIIETEIDFKKFDLETDSSKIVEGFDLKKILSGGPGKDGIPALNNPDFSLSSEYLKNNPNLKDQHLGIVVTYQEETRFYPYNILVWHEIVNDQIGDKKLAITFCPLCGSAIVYEREINKQILEFGVSGLLYESNLLMYDKKSESLWSQIEGRAVVGKMANTELNRFAMKVMTFNDAKKKYPKLKILSENTGYPRNYQIYPYGEYNDNDQLYFPVTYTGTKYNIKLKEVMLASTYKQTAIAFVLSDLKEDKEATIKLDDDTVITAKYIDGQATITDNTGNELVSYYSQWFSWANHNLEEGVRKNKKAKIWKINK